MKKVKLVLQALKADVIAAVTPELKREACQDAIALVNEFTDGIVREFAVLMITELEATIKG